MSVQVKVSIIIPVFNAETYLRECLDSIVHQTYKEIEVICVDDGSSDSSVNILREYEKNFDNLKVFTQENKNAGAARNHGLRLATGKYVLFLDSDDYFDRELVQKVVNKAEEEDADIVVFDHYRYDQKTKKTERRYNVSKNYLSEDTYVFNYRSNPDKIMSIVNPVPWNKLIKRSLLIEYGIEFEEISSTNDITFAALCVSCASRIVYLAEALMTYRVNLENSITSTKNSRLNNVIKAVTATYYKARAFVHYPEIEASVQTFVARNLLNALKNYVGDQNSIEYQSFVAEIGKLFFGLPLFYDLKKDRIKDATLCQFIENTSKAAKESFDTTYFPRVIVSVTSYPKRISTINQTIQTILDQTMKPDKIVLWLAESQFPNKEEDLPKSLTDLFSDVFCVQWTEDLRSYKKLIPAIKAYPDDIIITIDDDLIFDPHIVELLVKGYRKNPKYIQCHRITAIEYNAVNDIVIYPNASKIYPEPTYLHKLSGGAGCLYPPHCMHPDVFRKDVFMRLAPTSDDIWFWLMGALNGYKVNVVDGNLPKLKYVPGSQDEALWRVNDRGEKLFFVHLRNILYYYPVLQDILFFEQQRMNSKEQKVLIEGNTTEKIVEKNKKTANELEKCRRAVEVANKEIKKLKNSRSYRIGRTMTYIPRKVKGGIRCYKQHGMKYTLRRVMVKAHLLEDKNTKPNNIAYKTIKKIRGGIRCYKQHGFKYTFRRGLVHLRLIKDRSVAENKTYTFLNGNYKEKTKNKAEQRLIVQIKDEHSIERKDKELSNLSQKKIEQKGEQKAVAQKTIKRDNAYYSTLTPDLYEQELKMWYKRVVKEELDLNNPQTFNQKIQWLKLYDSTPIKTQLADKYLVRHWVEEKIGKEYLIPLLGVWDSFDEIDFSQLPDQFALKANHASGYNIIVRDKQQLDLVEAKKKFDNWMSRTFMWALEFHYMNIPKKIIAEQYMADFDGDIFDYRFFCFNGVPKYVWVDIGSGTTHHQRSIYDIEWNLQNYKVNYPMIEPEPKKPETYEEMLRCAKVLCKEFAFVRVDFYSVNGKVYFGEMTFTPQGGTGKWEDETQNLLYGSLIKLPPASEAPARKY